MENYNGPKSYVALHATNADKIAATIKLIVVSGILGLIMSAFLI
jgi:hypothetical protein